MGSPTKTTWTIRNRRDAKKLKNRQKRIRRAHAKVRKAATAAKKSSAKK